MTTNGRGKLLRPSPTLKTTHMETRNEYWHGLSGVRFLWHGDFADPELLYRGHIVSETEVTDYFWAAYQLGHKEPQTVNGETWKEYAEDGYHDYIVSHVREVKSYILAWGCPTTTLARTWRRVRKALR